MKKIFYVTFIMFGLCSMAFAQQQSMKKPKIMVVPEEAFCVNAGMFKLNHQGDKIADYRKALQNDDILDVINSFENIMATYEFPLTNLQQSLDALNEESVLDNVLTAKDDGYVVEDELDLLSRTAGADILVKVAPRISKYGPERKLELRVSAIDCASKKALRAFGPITKTSAGSTSMLLAAAISDNIEQFVTGLSQYFDDIKIRGREGAIIIKIAETCPLNLESTVTLDGEEGELADLIDYWLSEHTVNGSYTGSKSSRYRI